MMKQPTMNMTNFAGNEKRFFWKFSGNWKINEDEQIKEKQKIMKINEEKKIHQHK